MTMYLWLQLLAFGCVFLDIGIFGQGDVPTTPPGSIPPGKPNTQPAPIPSPTRTTASLPTSTSGPESGSPRAPPPLSAGGPSAETPLHTWDNASRPAGTGATPTQPPHLATAADSQTSFAGSDPQAPSKAPLPALTPALGGNDTAGAPAATSPSSTFPARTANLSAHTPSPAPSSPSASPARTSNSTTNSSGLILTSHAPTPTQSTAASSLHSTSTIAPTTVKPSCEDKFSNVSVTFHHDNSSGLFKAELPVDKEVICSPWPCNNISFSLKEECKTLTVNISHESCVAPFKKLKLYVPPDPKTFQLVECVNNEEADTSICLTWNETKTSKCDQKKIKYKHQCGDNNSDNKDSNKINIEVSNLTPQHNYTCSSEVYYDKFLVTKVTKNITTDFGSPGQVQNLTCNPTGPKNSKITWIHPQSFFHNFTLCYSPTNSGQTCHNLSKTVSDYYLEGLRPFTDYAASVRAFVIGKVLRRGDAATCAFQTLSTNSTKVTNLKVVQKSDNRMQVTCGLPEQINGRSDGLYNLNIIIENKVVQSQSNTKCNFIADNLYYSTQYRFEVFYNNGYHPGEKDSVSHSTSYNSKALIIFLVFLIIVTSIALLIVLYKIYDLHKRRSSNLDEQQELVRDDEKQLMNVEPIHADLLETYKRKIAEEG
uniref:Protein tyrosine phosphatase receptor type C n=1 Tax=Molossus molossus TaxID=27622 RepID=A0A7J8BMK0_MOLMO|nr:protein tyrosine phosphatase receptor type C [Molossus molossus]